MGAPRESEGLNIHEIPNSMKRLRLLLWELRRKLDEEKTIGSEYMFASASAIYAKDITDL